MVPSFDYHKKTAQNKGTKDNDPRKSRVSIIINNTKKDGKNQEPLHGQTQ